MITNYSITIIIGEEKPYDFELPEIMNKPITFGRNKNNDIVIDSMIVSNFHGFFIKEGESIYIVDKNSTNGIFINNEKIYKKTLLNPGDTIGFESQFAKKTQTEGLGVSIIFNTKISGGLWSVYKLDNKTVTIGRDEKADIFLNQGGVSLNHACIKYEKGKHYIFDSGSTNGIFINGEKISGKYELINRDVIFIGNAKIIYTENFIYYNSEQKSVPIDVISLNKIIKHKNSERCILENINFSIKPNEFVAIIGGSGTGKSTLMNSMCGFIKATNGQVKFDNEDLYKNYDALKSLIGYVPQRDIVHKDLTLYKMLLYTAQIRMPEDSTRDEQEKRIIDVLEMVELTGREDTIIKKLSGGQQKRASIAVELISDPNIFFLDEPTSGLDPGTERNLMNTLKNLTKKNKTVIVVTHMTMNIGLCDKLIVLGTGGKLCFFGTPIEALNFFGVENFVDIYDKLGSNSKQWQLRFENSEYYKKPKLEINPKNKENKISHKNKRNKISGFKQFVVLSKRYLNLIMSDKKRLALLLLQAPILAVLLSLVSYNTNSSGDVTVFKYSQEAKSFLFSLSCAAFWLGLLNSVQEICKERNILKRELMAKLKVFPYICSKLFVLGTLCLIQSILLLSTSLIILGSIPKNSLSINPFLGMYVTTFLTSFSATCLGLAVSSMSPNSDRAMTLAPIILMPQILFSGIAFNLKGFAEYFSNIINCKWSVKAYCILGNINKLPKTSDSTGITFESVAYNAVMSNLLSAWGALALISLICIVFCILSLWLETKD